MARTSDIAAVLLDVIMETDVAGLELVEYIRNELKNETVRIILRTGQPGQAPERRVIVQYDINDYKAKTELTADKLFTSLTAALRSYQQLERMVQTRRGLEIIIDAASTLYDFKSMQRLAEGVLTQLASLLNVDCAGILVLRDRPRVHGQAGLRPACHAADRFLIFHREFVQEISFQQREVLSSLSQAWQLDLNHGQPIVQVFPECALAHHGSQISIGGGDDSDIDRFGSRGAHALYLVVLQNPQKLALGSQGQLANLIQENGSMIRILKNTHLVLRGSGKCTLHVTKQFTFHQGLYDGRAVANHEGIVRNRR